MTPLRFCLAIAASAHLLAGCGGSPTPAPMSVSVPPAPQPPPADTTVSMAPADGAELAAGAPVVLRFSAPVIPASLVLDGELGHQATASWSSSTQADDTLTLSPPAGGWLGSGPLRVAVGTPLGERLQAAARYAVVVPLQTFQAAIQVIGQPDFQASDGNQGGTPSARTLLDPFSKPAVGPGGELFIADSGNSRVLRYPPPAPGANVAADLVLGQGDFTDRTPRTTRSGMATPASVAILGTRLAVTEANNHRVLLWNALPTTSDAPADVVIGQPDFTSNTPGCDARTLGYGYPIAAFAPAGQLLVTDPSNHRVLIWNQVPTTNGAPADIVLGQSGFDRCTNNDDNQDGVPDAQPSARTLMYPSDVWTDGQRLVVSDNVNHRVLIWHHFPTTHFQPADVVLGQADFAHGMRNDDDQDGLEDAAPTARTFNIPWSVHSNGVQLVVADYENNRVLLWSRFPTAHFQPADVVLGQSSFARAEYNDSDQDGQADQPSARTVSGPSGVLLHGKYLVVTLDAHGGHRALVFEAP